MAARSTLFAMACAGLTACGGGGGPSPPSPPPSTNPYVVTISNGGSASPKDLTVPPGSRVLFVNNDSRRHDMTSDDHPDHLECPALNQVGVLTPGQSRESGNLNVARTCGYHDHDNPDDANVKGRITIR